MIRFGPMSTSLCAGLLFGLLVAGLLCFTRDNRCANRLLAGVLAVFALKLSPYVLGFAGFYDRFPWLSFLPVSYGLALGPLVYLHVQRLTTGTLPPRWRAHFIPVLLQCAYYLVLFVQPLAVKNAWSAHYDGPWIDPAETWLELIALFGYLLVARRRYRAYQHWLDATLSNREPYRLPWLGHLLSVMIVLLPAWAGFEILSALFDFSYFQRFPLYVVLTGLVIYVGLEGWRHSDVRYPLPTDFAVIPDAVAEEAAAESPARDWAACGERWRDQMIAAQWWRSPDLSLPMLARHLGTNTAYLSRAFNDGLGQSFHEVVNRQRVAAAVAALSGADPPRDLLGLALSVGFSSKTSFNRLFKAATGQTPSAFRTHRQERGANL